MKTLRIKGGIGAGVCASVLAVMLLAVAPVTAADLVYGVDSQDNLLTFMSSTPGTLLTGSAISGLQSGEQIRGIDFVNGNLYGLGSFSDLYALNVTTAHATLLNTFTPALNGINYGFNSGPSQLYVATDIGQNLTLTTAGVATAGPSLSYAPGDVNFGQQGSLDALAYNYSSGTFYGIDGHNHAYVSYNPVTGSMHTIATGVIVADITGLDISPSTGIEYMATVPNGGTSSSLYSVDLLTGTENLIGAIGDSNPVLAIAVVPEPGSVALLAVGGLLFGLLRRKK
jgi:hypothetical protein